jgi:hypothetical protein
MPERLPVAEMPGLLRQPHPDIPLGIYIHVKSGDTYIVVGGTFLATGEDQAVFVHYVNHRDGYSSHRTPGDFLAPVPHPSAAALNPRFVLIRRLRPTEVCQVVTAVLMRNLRDSFLAEAAVAPAESPASPTEGGPP